MSDPHKIIDQLSPNDTLATLKALARGDETLAARIAEIAIACLDQIDLEEVWDRAGPTRHGYVDASEAASEMIQEVIAPYLEEIKKYQTLEMQAQANAWAIDAPSGFAWVVVDAWKARAPSRADVKALEMFIEEALGGWCAHLV